MNNLKKVFGVILCLTLQLILLESFQIYPDKIERINSNSAIIQAHSIEPSVTIENLKKYYDIKTEKGVQLEGQIITKDSIKSVYIILPNDDIDEMNEKNIFASAEDINVKIFDLSQLSSQFNVEKFDNNKKYNFIIYVKTNQSVSIKIGEFNVTVNIKPPVIAFTKNEYTITKNENKQSLLGKITAYFPISKVNVYIDDMETPLNYWENKYSKSVRKFSLNLREITIGDPPRNILQGIHKSSGTYDCKIEVISYGGVAKTSKAFTLKIVDAADILKIAKKELMTRRGTKYNKWYGGEDNDPWCAVFVMWCFDQAEVINHVGGKIEGFEYPYNWWMWYIDQGKAYTKNSDYIPKPGDLIFFDWSNNNGKDKSGSYCLENVKHVEIIEKVSENKIYTVGGNTGGGFGIVNTREWAADASVIIGYGENNIN